VRWDKIDPFSEALCDRRMIFLSYNRRDRALVLEIRQAIEGHGFETFLDDDLQLDPRLWPEVLENRLASATAVVVFVGSNGLGPWQRL
jgi:hypothetical protein